MSGALFDSYMFLALYVAHHGDGVFLPEEDDEIRRLAELAGVEDVSKVLEQHEWSIHQGADSFERHVQVIAQEPMETKLPIFHHLAEVVKSDNFIADGEAELIRLIREAWGIPPPQFE